MRTEHDGSRNQANSLEQRLKSVPQVKENASQNGTNVQAANPVQPNVNFFATIGSMAEYKMGDDWNIYEERLNQYFIANSVTQADRKIAVLVTLIGQDAYKILKDLCDSMLPSAKTYEDLCTILKSQFSKKVSVFRERTEFYELRQSENESVNQWYVKIKNKASACEFGAQLETMIKDKFVTGLRKGAILDRVCEEDHTKRLVDLLDVARKKEA